jgi:hypothetical protein
MNVINRTHSVTTVSSAFLSVVLVFVTATSAGAVGDTKVSSYVMTNPIAGGSALPITTLQPYLIKVEKALAPFAPTTGAAKVALKGWDSTSNGIQELVELSAFAEPIVDPSTQATEAVQSSCQSATGVAPKKVTTLTSIAGSVEAQCKSNKGVRLLTSISWARSNVLALVIVSGTTQSEAETWSHEQSTLIPASGIAVEPSTALSKRYVKVTSPLFTTYNAWLVKFHAWAEVNGTAAQATVFDHPLVHELRSCDTELRATSWPSNAAPSVTSLEKALSVIATQLTDLSFVTPATATKWGNVFAVDQHNLLKTLTAAQVATAG